MGQRQSFPMVAGGDELTLDVHAHKRCTEVTITRRWIDRSLLAQVEWQCGCLHAVRESALKGIALFLRLYSHLIEVFGKW